MILGLARQGKAFARFAAQSGAEVVVSDLAAPETLTSNIDELSDLQMEFVLGEHPMEMLEGTDVLAISGGISPNVPVVKEAKRRGIEITNDSFEFFKRVQADVIGITGSAGKTTTTALTGAMLQRAGRTTWIGGNIGRPLISDLHLIQTDDIVVQELSSFQLELWKSSPPVSAVLNITPNHLDRHQTMEAYSAAKGNIIRFQESSDTAVLSVDDAGASGLRNLVKGRLREFSLDIEVKDGTFVRDGSVWIRDGDRERYVISVKKIPLRGSHNVLNVLASIALADTVGVSLEVIHNAVIEFEGVEHRLEPVGEIGGVQYINDSIATAPERAIAALESFSEPIILLAGGRDKQMVWEKWAHRVVDRVKIVILFGELAPLMDQKLKSEAHFAKGESDLDIRHVDSMENAVGLARDLAEPGDIVLLSPGGTSFDAFNDFDERGRSFRNLVREIRDHDEDTQNRQNFGEA